MVTRGDALTTYSGRVRAPAVRRARAGVAPVWLIVGLTILCIAVALISSAHRADVVALEHERTLLSHALADRQSRLLREVEYVAGLEEAANRLWIRPDEAWMRQQIGRRFESEPYRTFVLLLEPTTQKVHVLSRAEGSLSVAPAEDIFADLAPVLARIAPSTRPREWDPPLRGTVRDWPGPTSDAALLRFAGQPAIIAAGRLKMPEFAGTAPVLAVVKLITDEFLQNIAAHLQLPNLRLSETVAANEGENFLERTDDKGQVVARFAWTPNRPGPAIIWSTLPFVGMALGCFVLLAGCVLRYSRRATETIAAGEDRLRHLALHDPLSNLPNRTLFGERLDAKIEEIKRGGSEAALLSIDLDHFKDVNDTLGHHVGDALISAVAQRLRRTLREDDLVARLGGDEFAVLSSGLTDRTNLEHLAERIISALTAPYLVAGHTLVIGASIGIVVIDRSTCDAADIMRFADLALYRAKNEGRNRACVYDAAMSADLTQRKQLQHDLRIAIEQNQLTLAYQPVVSPDGERVIGVEALCRWPHPVRGWVPPATFVAVAEQSELIIPLGEWVLRRACMDGRRWPELTVAVNVSPLQFRRPDFVEVVQRILDETGFDPLRLELELTESTLLGNVEGAESAMRRLKALGVKLALDDFGTGYSSLLYLRTFPFDKLKIDRSFVSSIESAADAAAIVHAIVSLGRGLGMKVTAEGVENAEQQLFLRAAGAHAMQGFLFGHPVDADEITRRLALQARAASPTLPRQIAAS